MLAYLKPAMIAGFLLFGAKSAIEAADLPPEYAKAAIWVVRKLAIIGAIVFSLLSTRNAEPRLSILRREVIAFAALGTALSVDALLLLAYKALTVPPTTLGYRYYLLIFFGNVLWGLFANFYIAAAVAIFVPRGRVHQPA